MRWGRDGETNVIFEGEVATPSFLRGQGGDPYFIDEGERAKFLDLRRREGEPSFYFRRDGGKPSTIYGIKSFLIFMNVKN